MPGLWSLMGLALLAIGVALALGFAIATWWLRPPRVGVPGGAVRTSTTSKG